MKSFLIITILSVCSVFSQNPSVTYNKSSKGTLPTNLNVMASSVTASSITNTVATAGTMAGYGPDKKLVTRQVVDTDVSAVAAINASKIANGNVSNTEFQLLDGKTVLGNVSNSGTPVDLEVPMYDGTSGTAIKPSNLTISADGNDLFVPGDLTSDGLLVGTLTLTNALGPISGGTGWSSLTDGTLIGGNGTNPVVVVALGSGLALSGSAGDTNRILSATVTAPATDVQIYTTTGASTWTNLAGAKSVQVILIAGGGGGGSGRKGAAGTIRCGGGGGGSGGFSRSTFSAAMLGATETVTVGAGGAGGAARTTDDTDGLPGAVGITTTFGAWLRAGAGAVAAGGGTATTGTAGTAGSAEIAGAVGGAASTTGLLGANGVINLTYAPASGGAGGGISSADAVSNGGTGNSSGSSVLTTAIASGTFGVSPGGSGGNGGSATASQPQGGGGGGGGASRITAGSAGNGGNGGIYGAGGGGGGAALNTTTTQSGAGGNGGNGIAIVITYF